MGFYNARFNGERMAKTMQTPEDKKASYPKRQLAIMLSLLFALLLFMGALCLLLPETMLGAGRTTDYSGLVISEVMAANTSAVPDENGEFSDWLELYNGTGRDLNMEGVMITNRTDRITFPFPSYTLGAGERVVVFASGSYQLDPARPFHGEFKIASAGDRLYLYDPGMRLIDALDTPTLTPDTSYALTGTDGDGTRRYEVTSHYSPGYENGEKGFAAYRSINLTEGGALVVNEVCPGPVIGIPDEDGEIVDWVELKNNMDQSVSLTGFALSDRENKPMKWRFPDGASIPADGYYLVYCSGKDKLQQNGVPHTSFAISAKGETVVLSDGQGRLIDRVSVQGVPDDYSYARSGAGDWRLCELSTPGQPNNAAGQARSDELFQAYNPTGIVISEVMASNSTVASGAAGATSDYAELYNASDETVDLSGYGLSDSLKRPRRWQFPQGTAIAPGEYKIVYLDGQSQLSTATECHANFKLSRVGGETISFCDPAGRVLDRIPLRLIPTDHGYGRTPGYSGFYYYDVPTPGAANGTGYYGYAQTPSVSMPGGEYKGEIQVSFTVPENTTVYYTLDGSIPTEERGIRYADGEALAVRRVTVLRARAFDPDGMLQPSEIVTRTYLMNLYHAFPIVSVVTDPGELWNPETGMLTAGPGVDKSGGIPFKNTIYRMVKEKLEQSPGHVEIYDKEGNQVLSQGMEFGLQGENSLDFPQKSFKVRAKARYGARYFSAKLFEDRPFTEYKSFVLRISGNDSAWTRLIDGFQGRLIDRFNEASDEPTTVIHQAWKPVVVYLNGVYWGHYNMRERVDRYFVAQHEGLSLEEADNMDILEASASSRNVNWGSNKEYKAMIERVKKSSPGANAEDLEYILENIDVDNYIDYMAFEMFFGNSDPGNIRYYRLKTASAKWKWIIYDMDYGLFDSGFNSPYSYLKEKGAGDKLIDNTLIRKLLESDQMRDKFLTRLGEIYQLFTTEYMTEVFDEMALEIEPEMPLHFARWAEETDKAVSFDNPTTPEGALRYWHTRLDRTRNILKKRPAYFYEMVQEQFQLSDGQMLLYFGDKPSLPEDAVYTEGKKWG